MEVENIFLGLKIYSKKYRNRKRALAYFFLLFGVAVALALALAFPAGEAEEGGAEEEDDMG
jgi:hypothetical protein